MNTALASLSDLRFTLRRETHATHERLDAHAGRLDLGEVADYRIFLLWHAALVPAMEAHLERSGIEKLLPDWSRRRRTDALASDLRALGVPRPAPAALDLPAGEAALVGTAYVLEGSRLGGAVLASRVDPALRGVATAYLEHGAGHKLWPRFVKIINRLALSEAETRAAADAANRTFSLFEATLRRLTPNAASRAAS